MQAVCYLLCCYGLVLIYPVSESLPGKFTIGQIKLRNSLLVDNITKTPQLPKTSGSFDWDMTYRMKSLNVSARNLLSPGCEVFIHFHHAHIPSRAPVWSRGYTPSNPITYWPFMFFKQTNPDRRFVSQEVQLYPICRHAGGYNRKQRTVSMSIYV